MIRRDSNSDKMPGFFKFFLVIWFLFALCICTLAGTFAYSVATEGLKGTVERIWEGPKES